MNLLSEKKKIEFPTDWILFDTMMFFSSMIRLKGETNAKPGLDYLCKLYNIEVQNRHHSFDDVKALAELIQIASKERSDDIIGFLIEYLQSVCLLPNAILTVKFGAATSCSEFNNINQ